MKKCCRCLEIKDFSEYRKNKRDSSKLDYHCKSCAKIERRSQYLKHRDKEIENATNWVKNNPDKFKEYRKSNDYKQSHKKAYKSYRLKNKDKAKEWGRLWYETHKDRAKYTNKKWRVANPFVQRAINKRRECIKRKTCPKWLNDKDLQQMKLVYREAKSLELQDGIKRHVDHIIPLISNQVCGLHVPWNLQILTATENIRKSNKLIN